MTTSIRLTVCICAFCRWDGFFLGGGGNLSCEISRIFKRKAEYNVSLAKKSIGLPVGQFHLPT